MYHVVVGRRQIRFVILMHMGLSAFLIGRGWVELTEEDINKRFVRDWLIKRLLHESQFRREWLVDTNKFKYSDFSEFFKKVCNGDSLVYVEKAFESNDPIFVFDRNRGGFNEEFRLIYDWISGLFDRDPRLFSKLDRITWRQALERSVRWHDEIERKLSLDVDRRISFDENCPVMYEHDDGMKWVWLKTDKARDDEGRIMGHCVGQGGYDHFTYGGGIYSLRDEFGCPYVTIEFRDGRVVQSKSFRNRPVPDKFLNHITYFESFLLNSFK